MSYRDLYMAPQTSVSAETGPLEPYFEVLEGLDGARVTGRVRRVAGLIAECEGLTAPVGAVCAIQPASGPALRAEVVGFRDDATLLMPFGEVAGVRRGDDVVCLQQAPRVAVGDALLGRVLDAEGNPLDGGEPPVTDESRPLFGRPPSPLDRDRIVEPLETGVRAIDAFHTCGRGQRIGLFSGSGVGKSVLLGMLARRAAADVVVVALVGERGREVREFLERNLGPEGRKRAVVVVETAERPPLLRFRAAFTATAMAEHFRSRGRHVLLLMDSLTRMANAQREIGLSAGEPPATRGYPPSVFATLPRLLERAGSSGGGSVTGIYSVLVEGDDLNEPVADAARSVLDGHLVLSRSLAHRGHYPAIDTLGSVSRLMADVAGPEHRRAAATLASLLAVHREAEDLINVGAYVKGANPEIDRAVAARPAILAFLRQEVDERSEFPEAVRRLIELATVHKS
jgi:flagellum-specific ATP synthase